MGMSTHVIGFRPPDEKWRKMKAVYDSCKEAGIEPPENVQDFFNGETPDENGVEVDLDDVVNEWSHDSRVGYELDVSKLPAGVKVIRFYNSY